MDVAGVKKEVRALCLDPDGDRTPDNILDPLLALAYKGLLQELDDADFAFDEETVEIPNIQPGTRDLRDFEADGKPLERMTDVRTIEWKPVGQPETAYVEARLKDRRLDVDSVAELVSWEITGGVIILSPVNQAIDLRLRCEMEPQELDSDGKKLPWKIPTILAFEVAALTLAPRNPALADRYERRADVLRAGLEAQYTKSNQGKMRRWGRTFGRRRGRGRYPSF